MKEVLLGKLIKGFVVILANMSSYSGVPGELRGMEYAHNKYGQLSWQEVIAPAIELARDGWTVNEDLIRYMDSVSDDPFLTDNPSWALDFAPNGYRLKLGETITRKRYANTLETIAQEGADAFYGGAIGNATVAALQAQGGTVTLQDLQDYEVALRETVHIDYRGYKLTSSNAPSSGVVALSVLNTVNGYSGFDDPSQVNISTHRLDEAMRWAYGQRTELGDPSFVDGLEEYTLGMISAETGDEIRSKISDERTYTLDYYNPEGLEVLDTPGTAHIATADANGMAVSLTTTVNLLFGSKLIVPETGVIMNNEMNDFSIPGVTNSFGFLPSPANFVRPGKRPLSSISPIIAETPDGRLLFAVGAAGGSRIITSSLLTAMNLIDGDMSIAEAVAEPRLHDQLSPEVSTFEYAYDNETVAFLEEIGHNVSWVAPGQSAVQGVALLANGTFAAAGEPRQKNSGGFAV